MNGDPDKENNPSLINMLHHFHRSFSASSFSTHSSMPSLQSAPSVDDDLTHTLLYYQTRVATDLPITSGSDETTQSDPPDSVQSHPIRDLSVSTVYAVQSITVLQVHESELQRTKYRVAARIILRYIQKYMRKRDE